MSSPQTLRLLRALEGDLSDAERAVFESDLARSEQLRAEFDQLRQIASDLAASDARLRGADVLSGIHARLDENVVRPRPGRWLQAVPWVAIGAAAAVGALFFVPSLKSARDEFQSKGGAPGHEASRWAGIEAFRVEGLRVAGRVEKAMKQSDGLAFAYRNTGEHPFRRLMIFATDAKNRVYWFYPSWVEAADDPMAIEIGSSMAPVKLRDVVRHDFEPGPLTIHALFTNEALRVKYVEAALKQPGGLVGPGMIEQRLTVMVEPAQ